MTSTIETAPSVVTAPAASPTDEPRTNAISSTAERSAPGRVATGKAAPRSALAEITLAHGQLEVVAARLAVMVTRPDLGPDRMDILDAAHRTHQALLSVQQARDHIEAITSDHPISELRQESSRVWTSRAISTR
jgi:hypothetical protein